jgi:hypothetical protein
VADQDSTTPHGMKMVVLAMQASAESQFEKLVQKLNQSPELPPTAMLRLRTELGSLIDNVERLLRLLDEHRQPKR